MPEKLKTFLKSLTPNEAKEIHDYFPTLAYLWEVNDALEEQIRKNPELWNEVYGNSIHDDRDATSIHD